MAKISIKAGTTSKLIDVFAQDSSVTTGAGLTGLAWNTGSLTAYYYIEGAASAVAITLATMTLGTWGSGGFIVVDGTNMPGMYQLGIPNLAIAAGAKSVVVMIKGASNLAPVVLEIELTANDNQDAVRGGMTALPNAAAEAAGGLYTRGTGAGQINQANNGQIDSNAARLGGTTQTGADVGSRVDVAVSSVATTLLATVVETGLTVLNALRVIAAAASGKLSGAATTTVVIRNAAADSKDRITATVDASGNRSAVTLDLT